MAERKTISGNDWRKSVGEKAVGITLPPDVHRGADVLAAALGLRGRAELGRRLYRWAVGISDEGKDLGEIRKILKKFLNS